MRVLRPREALGVTFSGYSWAGGILRAEKNLCQRRKKREREGENRLMALIREKDKIRGTGATDVYIYIYVDVCYI